MQVTDFKVGMQVVISQGYHAYADDAGRRGEVIETGVSGHYVRVKWVDGNDPWLMRPGELSIVKASPSVASDLRLTPQAKTVLAHLRKHGRITPMKAMVNYGISRLASCVHEIRKVGYDVKTVVERDESGHRFANYTIATVH